MRKTTKGEGKIEVLRGREAEVLNEHFAKTGKYAVSDFSQDERNELDKALVDVRLEENPTEVERAEDRNDDEAGGEE